MTRSEVRPIDIPGDALVVLTGPSGSGKSTFAQRHFAPEEVLSSDALREAILGDARDQTATEEVFRQLHGAAERRLREGLIVVIDATNVMVWDRQALLRLAERHGRPAVAIVFDLPLEECLAANSARPGRVVPAGVVRRQWRSMRRSLPHFAAEGFDPVQKLTSIVEVDRAEIRLLGRASGGAHDAEAESPPA
jgi:predicted kinase